MAKRQENVYDPLAAARVASVENTPALDDDFAVIPAETIPEEVLGPENPVVPTTVAPVVVPRYTVRRRITVSWGSQMITLNPGDIVSDSGYGPNSVERMRNAGVSLEELE